MTIQAKKRQPSSSNAPCLYSLRIELHPRELHPAIWRRLIVDGQTSLGKLHHLIQAAFGWTDAHLHEFIINDTHYAQPRPEEDFYDGECEDERKARISRVANYGDQFVYLYDFGDSWEHIITVENIIPVAESPQGNAWIDDGAGACPPEDVGGVPGYMGFLDTIKNRPRSSEAKELLAWAGGKFKPDYFDLRAANAAILRMLWNGWGGK